MRQLIITRLELSDEIPFTKSSYLRTSDNRLQDTSILRSAQMFVGYESGTLPSLPDSKDIQISNIIICTYTIRCHGKWASKTRVISVYSESASEAERESDDQSESGYRGRLGVVGNSNTILLFEGVGEGGRLSSDLLKVI